MLNRSRTVACPACRIGNQWPQGYDPAPAARLHCQAFIITYQAYLQGMLRREITRVMTHYADPDSAYQLQLLKRALARQVQTEPRAPSLRAE